MGLAGRLGRNATKIDPPANTGAVIQGISFVATIVGSLPVVALVIVGAFSGSGWYWPALVVGIVFGAIVLRAGILLGGRVVSRHSPELLAFTLRN